MKITYIHHSCYVAEGEKALVVFDYWEDPEGTLHEMLSRTDKRVYFVVSHFHEDHYNAAILDWQLHHEPARIIISYDTKKRRRVEAERCAAVMHFGDVYEDDGLRLTALRSTDVGVSYMLEMEGEKAFHAGDLNNWYFEGGEEHLKVSAREMEGLYLSIVKEVAERFVEVDHLMFPIDPRLKQHTLRGVAQWLRRIPTRALYPMHTWGNPIGLLLDELQATFPNLQIHWL